MLLKSIERRPLKHMVKDQAFKVKTLKMNIHRLMYFALFALRGIILFDKAMSFELGPPTTTIGFAFGWTFFWLFVQLWHLPFVSLLMLLLLGMQKFRGKNVTLYDILQTEPMETEEETVEDAGDDDADEGDGADAKAAIKNPVGMMEQMRQMKAMAQTVQNLVGSVASFIERVRNLFLWESPYLTGIVCIGLFVGTLMLIAVPFRYWVLLAGLNRIFMKGLRKYHPKFKRSMYYIPYSPLIEFIGRVPDNLELEQRRLEELPSELQTGTVTSLS
jgi:hypothetical protein